MSQKTLSQKSRNSGFTLVELLVVMAIVAILATAGVSTYNGYIKKSRDTVRLSNLEAVNGFLAASTATTGSYPTTAATLATSLANAGIKITEPSGTSTVCYGTATANQSCQLQYALCDSGAGYILAASFEDKETAIAKYAADVGTGTAAAVNVNPTVVLPYATGNTGDRLFTMGSCGTSAVALAIIN